MHRLFYNLLLENKMISRNRNIFNVQNYKKYFKIILSYVTIASCFVNGVYAFPPNEDTPLLEEGAPRRSLRQATEDFVLKDILLANSPERPLLNVATFASGVGRSAVYVDLAYLLGMRVLSHKVPSPGIEILSAFYGLAAGVPVVFLGARSMEKAVGKILTKKSDFERTIEKNRSCPEELKKNIGKVLAALGSMTSASTLTYLVYDKFHGDLGWGWLAPGVPTFYVRTLLDYDSIYQIYQAIQTEIRETIRDPKILRNPSAFSESDRYFANLRLYLRRAEQFIGGLNDSQCQKLLQSVLNSENTTVQKLAALVNPQSFFPDIPQPNKPSIFEKISSLAGTAFGVYGLWMYWPVTKHSFRFTEDIFVDDYHLQEALTAISLTTASAVTAISCYDSSKKLYNLVTSFFRRSPQAQERSGFTCRRLAVGLTAAFLAACNASMQAEVGLEFLDLNKPNERFELAAMAFSQFSLLFWAVDGELVKRFIESGSQQKLLSRLKQLREKIHTISPGSIEALHHLVTEASRQTLN